MKHIVVVSIECECDTYDQAQGFVEHLLLVGEGMRYSFHTHPEGSYAVEHEPPPARDDEDAQQRLYLHLRQEADLQDTPVQTSADILQDVLQSIVNAAKEAENVVERFDRHECDLEKGASLVRQCLTVDANLPPIAGVGASNPVMPGQVWVGETRPNIPGTCLHPTAKTVCGNCGQTLAAIPKLACKHIIKIDQGGKVVCHDCGIDLGFYKTGE